MNHQPTQEPSAWFCPFQGLVFLTAPLFGDRSSSQRTQANATAYDACKEALQGPNVTKLKESLGPVLRRVLTTPGGQEPEAHVMVMTYVKYFIDAFEAAWYVWNINNASFSANI
jgi:hypothetical protein